LQEERYQAILQRNHELSREMDGFKKRLLIMEETEAELMATIKRLLTQTHISKEKQEVSRNKKTWDEIIITQPHTKATDSVLTIPESKEDFAATIIAKQINTPIGEAIKMIANVTVISEKADTSRLLKIRLKKGMKVKVMVKSPEDKWLFQSSTTKVTRTKKKLLGIMSKMITQRAGEETCCVPRHVDRAFCFYQEDKNIGTRRKMFYNEAVSKFRNLLNDEDIARAYQGLQHEVNAEAILLLPMPVQK
jgi:hypothetical protein